MPPLTSRVLIQKKFRFPRPDSGYTTVVHHHSHQLDMMKRHYTQLQNIRIYRIFILLVILHESLSTRVYSFCFSRCYDRVFK
jgi:hypothetical protein